MKPSTQRFSSLMIAAGMIVGAIVVFLLLIKPAYVTIQEARGQIDGLTDTINTQQEALARVQALQAQYQNAKEDFKSTIGAMLPIGFQESEAFNHVVKLAEINHLVLQSTNITASALTPNTAPEASETQNILKPVGSIVFQLHLLGTYEDFHNLLKNIESNIRIMEVNTLAVTPAGKPDQDIYSFDISVVTYYQSI